ncbi:MAG: RHS repeat-associated core domain-containing protein [Pseudomonadota bacterium]
MSTHGLVPHRRVFNAGARPATGTPGAKADAQGQARNGATSQYTYDALGRLAKMIEPGDSEDLPTAAYQYHLAAPISYVRTEQRERSGEAGTIVTYAYVDGLARKRGSHAEAPLGKWAVSGLAVYGARGLVRFAENPSFAASADWRPADESQAGITSQHDALGRVLVEREVDGAERRWQYQPFLKRIYDENDTDPASPHFDTPTTEESDGLGRVRVQTVRDGSREVPTRYYYDALGNAIGVLDAAGHQREYVFDGRSRLVAVSDPNAGTWSLGYDDANGIIERTDGASNISRLELDRLGRQVAEWHALAGQTETLATRWYYDRPSSEHEELQYTAGRVSWFSDQAGSLYLGYDSRGRCTDRLRRWKDGKEHYTWTEYDAGGRPLRRGFPDGTFFEYSYDARGLLASVGGLVIATEWTAWSTIASTTFGNGTKDRREYDDRLRLARMQAMASDGRALRDLAFERDAASLVTAAVDGRTDVADELSLGVRYRYDDRYRLVEATDQIATTTWTYDDVAKILSVTSGHKASHLNVTNRYGENGAGPDQLTSFGSERLQYDAAGRLVLDGSRVLSWDAKSRLAHIERGGGSADYVYAHDDSRAEKVERIGGKTHRTRYIDVDVEERDGKLIRYLVLGGQRVVRLDNYTPPPVTASRKPSRSGILLGALAMVALAGFARRRQRRSMLVPALWKTAPGVFLVLFCTTCGHGGGGGGGGGGLAHDGTAISSWPENAVLLLADHIGSTVAIADAKSKLVAETAYHPYGVIRASRGNADQPYGYAAQERDTVSDLQAFGARGYRQDTATFLSVDPERLLGPASGKNTGTQLYAYTYARGNPVLFKDATGKWDELTHGAVLYHLAVAAGFTESDAADLALGSASVDHNPATQPVNARNIANGNTYDYHFTQIAAPLRNQIREQLARGKNADMRTIGRAMHTLRDIWPHGQGLHIFPVGHGFYKTEAGEWSTIWNNKTDRPYQNPNEFRRQMRYQFLGLIEMARIKYPGRESKTDREAASRIIEMAATARTKNDVDTILRLEPNDETFSYYDIVQLESGGTQHPGTPDSWSTKDIDVWTGSPD